MKTIGDCIKEARKASGLTQAEFAKRLHVYQKDVSRWERNEFVPNALTFGQICMALQTSADKIYRELLEEKGMTIYKLSDAFNGDIFDYWFFSLDEARAEARNQRNHLTAKEKAFHTMAITGYKTSIDSYDGTAEQLVTDLFNGDICPEYDPMMMFVDSSIVYEEDFE